MEYGDGMWRWNMTMGYGVDIWYMVVELKRGRGIWRMAFARVC